MRPNPETIKLGGKEFSISALSLRQVREIEPILTALVPGRRNIDKSIEIIAVGLSRDHPEAATALAEMDGTVAEIDAAVGSVLRLGGYLAEAPGEPQAA